MAIAILILSVLALAIRAQSWYQQAAYCIGTSSLQTVLELAVMVLSWNQQSGYYLGTSSQNTVVVLGLQTVLGLVIRVLRALVQQGLYCLSTNSLGTKSWHEHYTSRKVMTVTVLNFSSQMVLSRFLYTTLSCNNINLTVNVKISGHKTANFYFFEDQWPEFSAGISKCFW